jgi:broad specificity phosphatase PhoE
MRTTIYLVRHGDVHNPDQIMYERIPGFRLSELGRTQAHALGKFLSGKKIQALYASPLERTIETATIISSYHKSLSIIRDERLLEVSTVARGMSVRDLAQMRWDFYKPEFTQKGGETLLDIWKRMSLFLGEVVKKHAGQEIVVVSHGDPIMITAIAHKGEPIQLESIRGSEYVQTAKGYEMIFTSSRAVSVKMLDF